METTDWFLWPFSSGDHHVGGGFIIELMGNVPDQRVSNKYILIIMVNNGNHPQMALIQVSEIL